MAEFLGLNATKRDSNVPSEKINVNENGGRVRRSYDSFTPGVELSSGDKISMMKIPSGAKIIDARLIIPVATGGGPAGKVEVGFASDANALYNDTEGDFGAGAIDAKMAGTSAAYNAVLASETLILMECTENSLVSVGSKFELEVFWTLD